MLGIEGDISAYQALTYGGGAAEAAAAVPALLHRARETGNPSVQSWAYYVLGEAYAKLDPPRAIAAYTACVELGSVADNRLYVMLGRSSAVALFAAHEAPQDAIAEFETVLGDWEDIGNELSQWWVLQNLVIFLARTGAWADAALLAGAVLANIDRAPTFVREDDGLRRAVDELERALGSADAGALLSEGGGMAIATAAAHARAAIRRAA